MLEVVLFAAAVEVDSQSLLLLPLLPPVFFFFVAVFMLACGKGAAMSSPVPGMRKSLRAEMRLSRD